MWTPILLGISFAAREDCTQTVNGNAVVCSGIGTCNDAAGTCSCPEFVTGKYCDINYCGMGVINLMSGERVEHYCNLGGKCERDIYEKPRCVCRRGFSGANCEKFVCSHDNDCHNGGSCVRDTEGAVIDYGLSCVCPTGFSGTDCYENTCGVRMEQFTGGLSLCTNGGDCMFAPRQEIRYFYCGCRPGFSGKMCDTFECTDASMCNGGTCDTTTKACTCKQGYTNPDCSTPFCGYETGKECSGHGNCIAMISHRCSCNKGWMGDTCQLPACTDGSTVCVNGFCNMEDPETTFCQCYSGYAGGTCEACDAGTISVVGIKNGQEVDVCAHGNCIFHNQVCNNLGDCVLDEDLSTYVCRCNRGAYTDSVGNCIPRGADCPMLDTKPCGMGHCVSTNDAADLRWYCVCDQNTQIDSVTKACISKICFAAGETAACSGNGRCIRDTIGVYRCACNEGYTSVKGLCKKDGGSGSGGSGGLSAGAIAGIVIGVLAAVALIGFLVWWFAFRGKTSSAGRSRSGRTMLNDNTDSVSIINAQL